MNEVALIENPRPSLTAGKRPTAIVPETMDEAYRLAKAVCMAGMAPKGLDTPEKAMVAIMHGLEIGLTPMAALQRIAVVNGRPTIWGDGAMGLVRGSGLCEWVKERIEGAGDDRVAICEAKRKGEPEPVHRTFSVSDAKRAGLWNKQGPWQQFPERMMQMRARAFCLRDLFADVLGGLYLKEEIEDAPTHAPQPPDPPRPPAPTIEHKPEPQAEARAAPPMPPKPPVPPRVAPQPVAKKAFDPEAIRKELIDALESARTPEAAYEAHNEIVGPHEADLFPPDKRDLVDMTERRAHELEQ